MNTRKFFGQYLERPHVDVAYSEPDENDDGEAILEPIEQAAEPERPRHLPDPTRLRPLPQSAKPLRRPDEAITDGPKGTDRTEKPTTSGVPIEATTNAIPVAEKDTEMSLEDHDRRSNCSDDGVASTFDNAIDGHVSNVLENEHENIERIIEENFNAAIDQMVQNALHTIIIRRTEAELSAMVKPKSLRSI